MIHTVTVARNAMHTRFEIVLHGDNPVALRAAGEEALDEIERLDAQLSLFRPESEIAQLNARAAREPVRVTPELFALLQHARRLHAETGGAFDITLAPLLDCWGLLGSAAGRVPTAGELRQARARVGMDLLRLDESRLTVRFQREGVMLDLGAIGKGHAVDRAAEILRAAGITSALVHGGTSTAYAIGCPPDADSWRVAIEAPHRNVGPASSRSAPMTSKPAPVQSSPHGAPNSAAPPALAVVPLRDESLSVSAVWGKCFAVGGQTFGHILDPRSGKPANRAVLAAVVLPSATETDALSTALLVLGPAGHKAIRRLRPGMRSLLAHPSERDRDFHFEANGIELSAAD